MAIKGLGDARVNAMRRLSIGRMAETRCKSCRGAGGECRRCRGTGKVTYPTKLDHFEARRRVGIGDWEIDEEAMEGLGDRPQRVRVVLVHDDPAQAFNTGLASFRKVSRRDWKRRLWCHGDNETAERLVGESLERDTVECSWRDCAIFQAGNCKPYGNLLCYLPDAGAGLCELKTGSWHTIRQITTRLELLATLTGGLLAGIPVDLVIVEHRERPKGQQKVQTLITVDVEWDFREVQDAAWRQKELRVAGGGRLRPIAAPSLADEDEDDAEAFADEFQPERDNGPDEPPPVSAPEDEPARTRTRTSRKRRIDERTYSYQLDENDEPSVEPPAPDRKPARPRPAQAADGDDVAELRSRAATAFRQAFNSGHKEAARTALRDHLGSDSIGAIRLCENATTLRELSETLEAIGAEEAA